MLRSGVADYVIFLITLYDISFCDYHTPLIVTKMCLLNTTVFLNHWICQFFFGSSKVPVHHPIMAPHAKHKGYVKQLPMFNIVAQLPRCYENANLLGKCKELVEFFVVYVEGALPDLYTR
jgi:hypothetical protein